MSRIRASRLRRARWTRGVLLERDDRLVGGGGADHEVGLDQGLAEAVERDGLAAPARGGGLGPLGAAVGDQDPAGARAP